MASYDFLSISRGMVPGLIGVSKFGSNADIDTGTDPEDIISEGGLVVYNASAIALEAVSSSGEDSAAGTGAATILVEYLVDATKHDNTGTYIKRKLESVTLTGTTAVALASSGYFVNRVYVTSLGSGATAPTNNVGIITIRAAGAGATQAQIAATKGQTQRTAYMVSEEFGKGYIYGFSASISGAIAGGPFAATAFAKLDILTINRDGIIRSKRPFQLVSTGVGAVDCSCIKGTELNAGDIVVMRCNEVSADNTGIDGGMQIVLDYNGNISA